jgi:methylglutaconyl-CoA hydratase
MININLSFEGQVATVSLARPEVHNALNAQVVAALLNALAQLAGNTSLRVLVLKGEGPSFCAGADIGQMRQSGSGDETTNVAHAEQLAQLMWALDHFPKPFITVAHGSVFGGGLGLVACADVAIAADNTVFCFSEAKLGLMPAIISPYVIEAIGARQARRYFLTAERFDAHEAQRVGLIHEVVLAPELEGYTQHLIAAFLQGGSQAQAEGKKLIRRVAGHPLTQGLVRTTVETLSTLRQGAEGQEGLAAFLEKRPPKWMGGK